MTKEEQNLADIKLRAEIANLLADVVKMRSEVNKMGAETARIHSQRFWLPITVISGVASGFLVAAATVLSKLMS